MVVNKDILTEDLDGIEEILLILESFPDIWQSRIIKALARAVYHILLYLIKKDDKR